MAILEKIRITERGHNEDGEALKWYFTTEIKKPPFVMLTPFRDLTVYFPIWPKLRDWH